MPHWGYLVIDEAHRLKNKDGKALAVLHALNIKHKLALTGTPLQNNVGELWSVLNLLDPARFGDADDFEERYGDMHSAEQVAELQALLKPLMLRRLKGDVISADEIPAKEETIVWVELTAQQKRQYRALLDRNGALLASLSGSAGSGKVTLTTTLTLSVPLTTVGLYPKPKP